MKIQAKVFGVVGALILLGAATTTVEARPYERSMESRWSDDDDERPRQIYRSQRSKRAHATRSSSRRSAHANRGSRRSANVSTRGRDVKVASKFGNVGPRPRAWCGWWMRTQRGGGPQYNLAWNWSRWGRPSGPRVGAVVVWRHHVGEITGRAKNGQWIVRSGNDSNRVRERPRSVAGAVFRVAG